MYEEDSIGLLLIIFVLFPFKHENVIADYDNHISKSNSIFNVLTLINETYLSSMY
jgi:hypothetical protein